MKKMIFGLIAATTLISASVYAVDGKGYSSDQHPQALSSKAAIPPTNITVTNASNNAVYVIVPNSPIRDYVYSGNNDHIRHGSYAGDTNIALQDPYGNTFFNQYICHYGVVTVYGGPGSYRVNVDSDLCY